MEIYFICTVQMTDFSEFVLSKEATMRTGFLTEPGDGNGAEFLIAFISAVLVTDDCPSAGASSSSSKRR